MRLLSSQPNARAPRAMSAPDGLRAWPAPSPTGGAGAPSSWVAQPWGVSPGGWRLMQWTPGSTASAPAPVGAPNAASAAATGWALPGFLRGTGTSLQQSLTVIVAEARHLIDGLGNASRNWDSEMARWLSPNGAQPAAPPKPKPQPKPQPKPVAKPAPKPKPKPVAKPTPKPQPKPKPKPAAQLSEAQLAQLGRTNKRAFIDALRPGAEEAERRYGVPAAVTLAQAILETGWGQHIISGYNIFGIKGQGPAGTIRVKTFEYYGGRRVTIYDNFARYHSFSEAMAGHGKLFHNGYYNKAIANYQRYHDPERFARDITGIYATDPSYGKLLTQLMRQYKL